MASKRKKKEPVPVFVVRRPRVEELVVEPRDKALTFESVSARPMPVGASMHAIDYQRPLPKTSPVRGDTRRFNVKFVRVA
jgi:hypothetical protein